MMFGSVGEVQEAPEGRRYVSARARALALAVMGQQRVDAGSAEEPMGCLPKYRDDMDRLRQAGIDGLLAAL